MKADRPFRIRANGKLLLSGEYLVLHGAKALAMPTRYGQEFTFDKGSKQGIEWQMKVEGREVFFAQLDAWGAVLTSSGLDFSGRLSQVLKAALELSGLSEFPPLFVTSNCDFPIDWGLGTSSTLIYSIASFLEVEPYQLLELTFGGSGYDIACASSQSPGLYQRLGSGIQWTDLAFDPPFSKQIHFVHLNRKKDSREAIAQFRKRMQAGYEEDLDKIDKITIEMSNAKKADEFSNAMRKHEEIMSELLGVPTVKEELFPDYHGAIKSLGGWGGDFIMVLGEASEMDYFRGKGYHTIIPFEKMKLRK